MQNIDRKRKRFVEKVSKIRVSEHAIKKWKNLSWQWFQEIPQKAEAKREIIKMLKSAVEVRHRRELRVRGIILYGEPARYFRFSFDTIIVTDTKLSVVITVFPVSHPNVWQRKRKKHKHRRR